MPKSSAAEQSGESSTQTLSLLDEIIAKGRMAHDDSQQDYARDMLAEFATQVLDEGMAVDKDTVAMINDRISQIDALISDQISTRSSTTPSCRSWKPPGVACTNW